MLTELKPPVIDRALLILGKNIEIAQVVAQKMPVQIRFLCTYVKNAPYIL